MRVLTNVGDVTRGHASERACANTHHWKVGLYLAAFHLATADATEKVSSSRVSCMTTIGLQIPSGASRLPAPQAAAPRGYGFREMRGR